MTLEKLFYRSSNYHNEDLLLYRSEFYIFTAVLALNIRLAYAFEVIGWNIGTMNFSARVCYPKLDRHLIMELYMRDCRQWHF